MSTTPTSHPLTIYYEHPDWFGPLFAELDRRGIAHERLHADGHFFDPGQAVQRPGIVFNRLSPSAWQRGRTPAVPYTTHLLRYLEDAGVRVINGVEAWRTEVSKAHQIALLRRLGLPHPDTRVVHDREQAVAAARTLAFPVVVKPNVGGSGAGIRRFDSLQEIEDATDELDFGIDHTGLVQEFIPARDGHIVRVEVLNGRFLYAIAVCPPEDGFNLCPADACVGADGQTLERTFCAVDAPANGLRVEAFHPPLAVREEVERIMAAAGIEVGGVEYVVDDRDGRRLYYDINALSNFVADAERVIGFDPFVRLVDWLEEEIGVAALAAEREPEPAGVV